MATLPEPPFRTGRRSPWGKLEEFRREFDRIVFTLIDKAEADPNLEERTDILALMLRSRYEDGTTMSRQDISDELLTLVGAGHETTASSLGWAFERLRRHPDILAELVKEVDAGGSDSGRRRFWSYSAREQSSTSRAVTSRRRSSSRRVGDSARLHDSGQHRRSAREPGHLPGSRSGSTRTASSTPGPRRSRGCRSAAERVAASVPPSRTPRWTSCSGLCWRTSESRRMTRRMRRCTHRGVAYTPKDGGRVVVHRRK